MRVTSHLWLACLAMAIPFLASALRAQQWEPVAPGMRVSIRVVDSLPSDALTRNAVIGRVLHRDGSSFYVRVTSADTLRVPYGSISQLSISHGHSRVRSALKYGFEGALFGLFIPSTNRTTDKFYRSLAAGTVIGAVIGTAVPDERWRRVKR